MTQTNKVQHTGEVRPHLSNRADTKSHSTKLHARLAHANDNFRPDVPPSAWSPSDERVVDLFAGAGGLSLGFQGAGFPVAAAVDAWPAALATYRANHGHPAHQYDLSDVGGVVDLISAYDPTVIIGGPPCQDFSRAGKRIAGARASLTVSFAETVSIALPRVVLMENVPAARSSAAYCQAIAILRAAGYGLTMQVLDASRCGVPQRRSRLILVGRLDTPDNWLTKELESFLAPTSMTVREYLGDELGVDHYYHHPRYYDRKSVYSVDEPSPTLRGVGKSKPCPGVEDHPSNAALLADTRGLKPVERARLQTFPASYHWSGSMTAQHQQIGNAVPPELGRYVATAIARFETNLLRDAANDNFGQSWPR